MWRRLDHWIRRLGYVPDDEQMHGEVVFKPHIPPHIDLTLPNGKHLYGWVIDTNRD